MNQPFVIGPGFSPVPGKLAAQIVVASKYVDLSEILLVNLELKVPNHSCFLMAIGPHLATEKRLAVTSTTLRLDWRCSPHRWKDLLQYQLLILPTHHHFSKGECGLPTIRPFVSTRQPQRLPTGLG